MRDEITKRVRDLWGKYSTKIEEEFGLESTAIPKRIMMTENGESPSLLGGRIQDETLYLPESLAGNALLFAGTVAALCFEGALQTRRICDECIKDLSMEFARQQLGKREQAAWTRMWEKTYHPKYVDGILVHSPARTYPALFRLMGVDGLKGIVRDIQIVERYKMELSFEEYVDYLESRIRRFSTALDRTALHIVNELLNNPSSNLETVSKRLGISPQWVSTRITKLRQRHILRKFDVVRFSRIGIRMFNLLLGSEAEEGEPDRFLAQCPFLHSVRPILSGSMHLLATLFVPDNPRSIKAIDEFVSILQGLGISALSQEVISSGTSDCFDYYSPEESSWRIPWDLESVQVNRIHKDGLASALPRVDTEKLSGQPVLDELDIRILAAIRAGANSVSKIRKHLKAGQERVAAKLRDFREIGIVSTIWEVHNIGLNEHVLVTTFDPDLGESIAAWVQRLPRSIVSFNLKRELTLISSLPTGGSYGMTWTLRPFHNDVLVMLLDNPTYAGRPFPVDLWDYETNRWLSPRNAIVKWLDSTR